MRELNETGEFSTGLVTTGILMHLAACAAQLGIPDALTAPATAGQVARGLELDEPMTSRLFRALEAVEILQRLDDGRYRLTPRGSALRADSQDPVAAWLVSFVENLVPALGHLAETVRHGRPAPEVVGDAGFYSQIYADRSRCERWQSGMSTTSRAWFVAGGLLDAVDWSAVATVADLGGGDGTVVASLASHHAHLRGVVVDHREAVAARMPALRGEQDDTARRVLRIAGDIRECCPVRADVYMLIRVVFNLTDADADRVLGAVSQAMTPAAELLVVEPVLDDLQSAGTALADTLLMVSGGRVRSADEWESMATRANLSIQGLEHLEYEPWRLLRIRRREA